MRKVFCVLPLAMLWQASFSGAELVPNRPELAPYSKMGVTWGHLHIHAKDRYKETLAWLSLGAQLGNNLSGNMPMLFPGIVLLLQDGTAPTSGTEGTVTDHVAFRVADLQETLAHVKSANWGMHAKDEPGTKPGQAFLMSPSGIKIELLEDKKLKVPIVFDHVHFLVPESGLKDEEEYYKKMFGAVGEGDTLSLPGGKLVFSKTDKPKISPIGSVIDHIGFDIAGSNEGLEAFSKAIDAKGTKWSARYRKTTLGNSRPVDPSGVLMELTHGQGGYFDYKKIEPAILACETRPMKPPCW